MAEVGQSHLQNVTGGRFDLSVVKMPPERLKRRSDASKDDCIEKYCEARAPNIG
ncbi:hypothetical protein BGZ76_006244, partial [Entomortierella beljakovae]